MLKPKPLSPKEAAFVLAYMKTGNASEAYRQSYNTNASAKTIHEKASRLLAEGNVSARFEAATRSLRRFYWNPSTHCHCCTTAFKAVAKLLATACPLPRAAVEPDGYRRPLVRAQETRRRAAALLHDQDPNRSKLPGRNI
jgi:hypothetical protein